MKKKEIVNIKNFKEELYKRDACEEALRWVRKRDLKQALEDCKNVSWISWGIWDFCGSTMARKFNREITTKTGWEITITEIFHIGEGMEIDLDEKIPRTKEYKNLLKVVKATAKKYIKIVNQKKKK